MLFFFFTRNYCDRIKIEKVTISKCTVLKDSYEMHRK